MSTQKKQLYKAIYNGDLESVKILISKDVDLKFGPNFGLAVYGDVHRDTPLFLAINLGQIEIAKFLIDKIYDIDAIKKPNSLGRYLYFAIERNQIEIVKYIIDKGANVNELDLLRNPPLFHALISDKIAIAKYLINKGADINQIYNRNINILYEIEILPILIFLAHNNIPDKLKNNVFIRLALKENARIEVIFKELNKIRLYNPTDIKNFEAKIQSLPTWAKGYYWEILAIEPNKDNIIHKVVESGDIKIIQEMLEYCKSRGNIRDILNTPTLGNYSPGALLMINIPKYDKSEALEIMKLFLKNGADPLQIKNEFESIDKNPDYGALGLTEIIKLLDQSIQPISGADGEDDELYNYLRDKPNLYKDIRQDFILQFADINSDPNNFKEKIQALDKWSQDYYWKNVITEKDKDTILHSAIDAGDIKQIEELLAYCKKYSDIEKILNHPSAAGYTPGGLLLLNKNKYNKEQLKQIMLLFLENGADPQQIKNESRGADSKGLLEILDLLDKAIDKQASSRLKEQRFLKYRNEKYQAVYKFLQEKSALYKQSKKTGEGFFTKFTDVDARIQEKMVEIIENKIKQFQESNSIAIENSAITVILSQLAENQEGRHKDKKNKGNFNFELIKILPDEIREKIFHALNLDRGLDLKKFKKAEFEQALRQWFQENENSIRPI